MTMREGIEKRLKQTFENSEILVAEGSPDHFEVTVISDKFEGLSLVQRHRLVYGALGNAVGREIHALALKTETAKEAQKHV